MAVNILIVDDSAVARLVTSRIAGMMDIEIGQIVHAHNGAVGLNILNKSHFDLVITGLNMPQMDGLELVRRIRQSENLASIPVLVVSAETNTTRAKKITEQGIAGYVRKPFNHSELRNAIESALPVYQSEWTPTGVIGPVSGTLQTPKTRELAEAFAEQVPVPDELSVTDAAEEPFMTEADNNL